MILTHFKQLAFVLVIGSLVTLAPRAARADDETSPQSVEDFMAQRQDYTFSHICTNASAKAGWLMFRNRDSISKGMRFLILPNRVIGPEPVTIDQDTQATIDTGDVMGATAQHITYLDATIYHAKDGSDVRVVSRASEKLVDYSTVSSTKSKAKPLSIRCTTRHLPFDKLPQLAANFKETSPHESKIDDSDAVKQKNLEDFLWRQVRPTPATRVDAK